MTKDRLSRCILRWVGTFASCLTAAASAQGSGGGAPADALLSELARSNIGALSPAASPCARYVAINQRVCAALVAERLSELTASVDEIRKAEELLSRVVVDQPTAAEAWYGLGLARIQLAHKHVISREGPALPVGVSYEFGAANAFMKALEFRPDFGLAANALALLREPDAADAIRVRVTVLRQARGLLSGEGLAATAALERDFGALDSAIALSIRALARGDADSGVVSVALARDLYHAGRAKEGTAVLFEGTRTATDAGRRTYRDELEWVASPKELSASQSPTAARPEAPRA